MPDTLAEVPVVEQVIRSVVADLGSVTITNGYHIDLKPIRPDPRLGTTFTDGTAAVWLGDASREDGAFQYEQWRQSILIRVQVSSSDESETDENIETKLWAVCGDIHHALCKDQPTRQRDKWAIHTEMVSINPLPRDMDANEAMADVEISVQLRHSYGNPFLNPFRS